jgi:hypothetical protein
VISDQAPVMANPFEYRETLWKVLYEGEDAPPPKTPDPPATPRRGRGRHATPSRPGAARKMTRSESSALASFNAEVAAIAARKSSEGDGAGS